MAGTLVGGRNSLLHCMYMMYICIMTAAHYDTVAEGRRHFKELLDAAETGIPAVVDRHSFRAAVVDGDRLRHSLAAGRPARADVVSADGGWAVILPGLPLAAEGATFDEALDDMVTVLREYGEDWAQRLRHAPNHQGNWDLVQLVNLSTDAQLKEWISA